MIYSLVSPSSLQSLISFTLSNYKKINKPNTHPIYSQIFIKKKKYSQHRSTIDVVSCSLHDIFAIVLITVKRNIRNCIKSTLFPLDISVKRFLWSGLGQNNSSLNLLLHIFSDKKGYYRPSRPKKIADFWNLLHKGI